MAGLKGARWVSDSMINLPFKSYPVIVGVLMEKNSPLLPSLSLDCSHRRDIDCSRRSMVMHFCTSSARGSPLFAQQLPAVVATASYIPGIFSRVAEAKGSAWNIK